MLKHSVTLITRLQQVISLSSSSPLHLLSVGPFEASKGLFTKSKNGDESEKGLRKNNQHQRKFSLSLVVNGA